MDTVERLSVLRLTQDGGSQVEATVAREFFVTLFLNDKEISELLISQESRFVERIPISLGMLGTRPVLVIKIEVDPAVIPAEVEAESEDSRLLGLKVFSIHLSPR